MCTFVELDVNERIIRYNWRNGVEGCCGGEGVSQNKAT